MPTREEVIEAVHELDAARAAQMDAQERRAKAEQDEVVAAERVDAAESKLDAVLSGRAESADVDTGDRAGRLDRIVTKGIDVGEGDVTLFTIAAYGEDTPTFRNRTRSMLHHLKTTGRCEGLGNGRYRFPQPASGGES